TLCNCDTLTIYFLCFMFFFSSRRRHTRFSRDWSSDVCSSDLYAWALPAPILRHLSASTTLCGVQRATTAQQESTGLSMQISCSRSEERRVGKECRSRWSPDH